MSRKHKKQKKTLKKKHQLPGDVLFLGLFIFLIKVIIYYQVVLCISYLTSNYKKLIYNYPSKKFVFQVGLKASPSVEDQTLGWFRSLQFFWGNRMLALASGLYPRFFLLKTYFSMKQNLFKVRKFLSPVTRLNLELEI